MVDGLRKVLSRLKGVTPDMIDRVAVATEKTAVLVANHAKSDHTRGFAHSVGRYENQTTNLTNSIKPDLTKADAVSVEAVVAANKEYAAKVEYGDSKHKAYPFMHPALVSQQRQYKERVRAAIHGNV